MSFLKCLIFSFLIFSVLSCTSRDQNKKKLVVFTHSSFQSSYGPGPELKELFEKKCDCLVEFVNAGDAGILLQRLQLEKTHTADLIVGLDQLSLLEAEKVKWRKFKKQPKLREELKQWRNDEFLPYDWAPMTMIHQKGKIPTAIALDDLLSSKYKKTFSLQDPRMSTPGFQFLLWILHLKGEKKGFEFLKKFNKNVYRISPSWSASYGLFQKGKAKGVFSYFTSAVYHWSFKKDFSIQPFVIKEGHPVQLELMAIPDFCKQCELAEDFSTLMLSVAGQKIIMNRNFMLPVISGVSDGTLFEKLPKMKTFFIDSKSVWVKNKKLILKKWYKSLGG